MTGFLKGAEKLFVRPLLEWYGREARILPWRSEPTPYRVWVSEIMLQQTRVEAALPYFERFMRELPDISALAEADPDRLLQLWEGLGYYSRVRNLQKAAKIIRETYHGSFPDRFSEALKLPGIGEYTAGAILSIAFGRRVPAVDGNVVRVLCRAALIDSDPAEPAVKKEIRALAERLVPEERPGDFNQALMDLGARICRPNGEPYCLDCPVSGSCGAFREKRTAELPLKAPKKEKRRERRTVLVIVSPEGALLRRRPERGLLAGMWEFPNVEGIRSAEEIQQMFSCGAARVTGLPSAKHVFSHIVWEMCGYRVETGPFPAPEGCAWIPEQEMVLPSAFSAYRPFAR